MQANEEWRHCGKPMHEFKRVKLPRGTEDSHQEFKIDLQRHYQGKQGPKKKKVDPEAVKAELLKAEAKLCTEIPATEE